MKKRNRRMTVRTHIIEGILFGVVRTPYENYVDYSIVLGPLVIEVSVNKKKRVLKDL
jgi:hypothetical protein